MTISDLVPNLQPMVEDLSQQLRFICFFVLTASIVVRTGRGGTSIGQLVRPIVTNIILCGIIATLSIWFNLIRDEFWNIAVSIRTEFTGSVDGTGAALMQLIQPPDTGIDWLDVGNSLMKAVQYALGWLIVWIGGLIQLPMMIVQFVMECLCYLFLPIALSLFAFESTKGLAIRYIQQTLAILAWPIGFAVVDLVGYSLLTSGTSVVSAGALAAGVATGFTPAKLVIGGIVAIWLILGSLVTPIVMQMLFCSGTPMSSAIGHAIQMGAGLMGASRLLPQGGGSAPTATAAPSTSSGSSAPPSGLPPLAPGWLISPREGWRCCRSTRHLPRHSWPPVPFMIPIQPVSTRLNDEQRAKLQDLAEWLNWSESDVVRYCVLSVHQIVCQKPRDELPVMIRMAREGRRNPVSTPKKRGGPP